MGYLKVCSHFTLFSVLGTIDLAQVQLIEIQFKAIAGFFAPLLDDWVGVPKIIFLIHDWSSTKNHFFLKLFYSCFAPEEGVLAPSVHCFLSFCA